jgi:hypothetical protein
MAIKPIYNVVSFHKIRTDYMLSPFTISDVNDDDDDIDNDVDITTTTLHLTSTPPNYYSWNGNQWILPHGVFIYTALDFLQ